MNRVLKVKLAATMMVALVMALFATQAHADQILGYGQSSSSNTVTFSQVGGTTTITASDVGIVVTNYAGGGAPFLATLNLSATNSNAATVVGGVIHQNYSGTFCITSAAGCGGTNYLSGTFIDDFTANVGGSSGTFGATTPPTTAVTFTSSILGPGDLGVERALSFSWSNVTPVFNVCGTGDEATVCSTTASQSGTFSANNEAQVPEPATLSLLGLGLAGMALLRRRKQA